VLDLIGLMLCLVFLAGCFYAGVMGARLMNEHIRESSRTNTEKKDI